MTLQCETRHDLHMMTHEEQERYWTNAYNAALTGLLASKTKAIEFTANNLTIVTKQCKAFADQAVKDLEGLDENAAQDHDEEANE